MLQAFWKQPKNTGSFIKGYIVYWGTTSGGPYTSNSGLLPILPRTYIITGLNPGTTYYVVVQAIGSVSGCNSVNSNQLSNIPGGTIPAAVTAWRQRVINNGGPDPASCVTAVTTWYNALVTAGIDTLMKDVCFFCPDSLISSLTPFFVTSTANLWTCVDIQSITANGLATGVNGPVDAGGVFPSYYTTSTAGLTWYGRQPGGNAMGAAQFGGGTGAGAVMFQYTNAAICYQNPANQIAESNPFALDEYGFMSNSRTALNAFDAYRGNGNNALAAGGATNAAASGVPPAGGRLKTGSLAGNPFFYNFSANYIHSFFAGHLGLTFAQTQALFNATQALRQAFGGGFT